MRKIMRIWRFILQDMFTVSQQERFKNMKKKILDG